MQIRPATEEDIPGLHELLIQVCNVHAEGRPDLFIPNARKYTDEELAGLIADPKHPIFVAVDENREEGSHELLAHAFCEIQDHAGSNNLCPETTLYLDDLCVNANARGQHVGEELYRFVLDYAKEQGFYRLTLHVWSCNPKAQGFYEHMGLVPYMVGMEQIL